MTRRVLIIAHHYPPIQGSSGVHRALGFSKYLPEFGWSVAVLTVHPRAHEQVHADNARMIPAHVEMIRAQAWDTARHFSLAGRYPSFLARPDRWSTWIPFARSAALRAHRRRPFDALFSTFPIASAHVVGRDLSRRARLPWIADFRDPMATATYPHEPALRSLWRRIQDDVMREASRITVTTPGAGAFYRNMYPQIPAERVAVIENGFDPEIFASAARGADARAAGAQARPLVLLHSGILYPRERDPRPFFTALRTLRDQGELAPGELIVRLRASGFESEYRAMAAERGVQDLIEFAPAAPYTDALREMGEATALLVMQARVCNEQIPAKAYEYLYAGRPILGLTDPQGDTGRLLARFGVDAVAPLEDAGQIASMLARSLPRLRNGSAHIPPRQDVMSVSRRAGAEQLAQLLNAAADARR